MMALCPPPNALDLVLPASTINELRIHRESLSLAISLSLSLSLALSLSVGLGVWVSFCLSVSVCVSLCLKPSLLQDLPRELGLEQQQTS